MSTKPNRVIVGTVQINRETGEMLEPEALDPAPGSGLTLEYLVREVMAWHADPESTDYNECDKEPCYWCANAISLIGPYTKLSDERPH